MSRLQGTFQLTNYKTACVNTRRNTTALYEAGQPAKDEFSKQGTEAQLKVCSPRTPDIWTGATLLDYVPVWLRVSSVITSSGSFGNEELQK